MTISDKQKKILFGILAVALVVIIFHFSGGIISSIFECGKELGSAIRNSLM